MSCWKINLSFGKSLCKLDFCLGVKVAPRGLVLKARMWYILSPFAPCPQSVFFFSELDPNLWAHTY